jgi:hypothetical protein
MKNSLLKITQGIITATYKKFIKQSKLINARRNFGIIPSWSPKSRDIDGITFDKLMKFAIIPIDHVLHNSKVKITSFKTGKSIGSDHLPIEVSFWLSTQKLFP